MLNNHYFRFFKSRPKCIYRDIFSEGPGVQNNQHPPGVQIQWQSLTTTELLRLTTMRTGRLLVIPPAANTICMKPNCIFSLSFFSKHQRWILAWRDFLSPLLGSDILEAVWKMNKTHFQWERVSSVKKKKSQMRSVHLDPLYSKTSASETKRRAPSK